jgi:hypothetical protein
MPSTVPQKGALGVRQGGAICRITIEADLRVEVYLGM